MKIKERDAIHVAMFRGVYWGSPDVRCQSGETDEAMITYWKTMIKEEHAARIVNICYVQGTRARQRVCRYAHKV